MRNLVLRLGDVAIPVGLVASVREADETKFRLLHRDPGCLAPTTSRVYCLADERILEPEETTTAWEVAPGQFLELADDELAALRPVDSSIVDISGFVPLGELDPLVVRKRYHLAPGKAWIGRRPYRALAEAMHDLDVAAIARFSAWNSEQLAAVTSRGIVLELATLHFFEDIVQADEIAEAIDAVEISSNEHELMTEVVARYTRALKPDDLASLQRPRIRHLLEAKLAGHKIVDPDVVEERDVDQPAPVDLEAALKRTLRAAPRKRRAPAVR